MDRISSESGFSAAELLITLFIASLFLISGFQLYSYVLRDGQESSQLSKASNIAYQYLRSTAGNTTYVKTPCSTSTQPTSQPIASDTGLKSASVIVVVSCPYTSAPLNTTTLLTATVTYASPSGQETIRHALLAKGVSTSGAITFNYTGSIQNWTVPEGITSITILAKGAQGGSGTTSYTGGLGASMQGTFAVTPGDVLKILVGQQGVSDTSNKSGGGGGGSFVTTSANSPLIVAGGGSGGGGNSNPSNGSSGLTTTTGGSSPSHAGGTGGAGSGSSGGGGLTGNGTNTGYSGPGMSFTNGGAGGTGGSCGSGRAGGFGGGSGGEWCSQGAPGAGGGYSGGAGVNSSGVAGGGGSYNNGTGQTNTAGAQSGDGQVKINW